MSQQGDIFLFQTNNDGEVNVVNGIIEMSSGLDTAAYLSLFGGNEDCSRRDVCPFSWWGNFSEDDKAKKYISETQYLLKTIPAITANLLRIEEAARRDLNWFLENKIASSVTVIVTIPALNSIKINIVIEANGIESIFEFVENWKHITETTPIVASVVSTDITTGIDVSASLSQQMPISYELNNTGLSPLNRALPELNTTRFK